MKMFHFTLAFLALFSSSLFAHEGHDHSSPMAFFEHLLWMAPMVIAVAVAFYWFENRKQNNKD